MAGLSHWKAKVGGLAIYAFARHWISTLDRQVLFYDRSVDPALPEFAGPNIYIFWHEYILPPFYARGHCKIAMLISRHRDAEWLSQAARHMGFETVRGSTNRGGDAALRELMRKCGSTNLAITPDGPRGPRRKLASGCVYVASRLGIPLVPFGMGYDRPWRVNTWDRFAIPRPYSRLRFIVGPRLHIPSALNRQGIELHRQHVESVLNELTEEAESWAASGARRPGQESVAPQPMPLSTSRNLAQTNDESDTFKLRVADFRRSA